MLNHDEKIKQAQKKKKVLLVVVLIIVGVFMLLGITLLILSGVRQFVWDRRVQEMNPQERLYIHGDADWDRNIFEDNYYMSLDRSIRYNDGGVLLTVMNEDNIESYPPAAQFMYDAVYLIINGDYEAYNNLFAPEYWENGGEEYWFPMQALYKIELQIISMEETTADVILSYMIYRNDGMFRRDLPYNEEAVRPIVYRLVTDSEGGIKVSNKFPFTFIAGGN